MAVQAIRQRGALADEARRLCADGRQAKEERGFPLCIFSRGAVVWTSLVILNGTGYLERIVCGDWLMEIQCDGNIRCIAMYTTGAT